MTYGGYMKDYRGNNLVSFEKAEDLSKKYGGRIRVYPGSVELRDGQCYALGSRTVAVFGAADDINNAREISLDGIKAIDGPLWNRWDVASEQHIEKSIMHMKALRGR
jgi:phosphoribosylamine-glycine ligase